MISPSGVQNKKTSQVVDTSFVAEQFAEQFENKKRSSLRQYNSNILFCQSSDNRKMWKSVMQLLCNFMQMDEFPSFQVYGNASRTGSLLEKDEQAMAFVCIKHQCMFIHSSVITYACEAQARGSMSNKCSSIDL
jgi:hypothetical protein